MTIIKLDWMRLGYLKFLFTGCPADTAYLLLNITRFLAVRVGIARIANRLRPPSDSGFMQGIKWFLLKNAGRLWVLLHGTQSLYADIGEPRFNLTIFGLLSPLRIYATLQHQLLIAAWPPLPPPEFFNPFSPSSPLRLPHLPDRLDGGSCVRFLASLAVNPVVLLGVQAGIRPLVQRKVQKYTHAALPAPDFPDTYSLQAAIEDEIDRDNIPGLGNAGDTPELWESRSVKEELAKDLQYIGRNFQILQDKFWTLFASKPKGSSPPPPTEPLPTPPPTPASLDPLEDDPSPPSPSYDPSSSSASRPSSPRPNIEITGSTTSSGTVHMSVSIPVRSSSLPHRHRRRSSDSHPRDDPGPSSPSAPGPTTSLHLPNHRITTLTAQAADSMAQHLAGCITDVLLLPLEALYVRSVALWFLCSPAAGFGATALAERWVYPLDTWFGDSSREGWRGVADYVGKMVLVQGLERGIGIAVWQVSVGLSWWVGRKWFEWGRR